MTIRITCNNGIARRFYALTLLTISLAFGSAPALAELQFSDAYNFRDYIVNPTLNFRAGDDFLYAGIYVVDSETGEAPAGAVGRATNQLSGEVVTMGRSGTEFWLSLHYTLERAAGDWLVEIDSDVGDAGALIPAFGIGTGTERMPVVENFAVTPGAQPIFTWDLPADIQSLNDGNVDRLRARIRNSNGSTILDDRFDNSLTATTYTVAADILIHNGYYRGQIMVEGLDPFNRGSNYAPFVVEGIGVGGEPIAFVNDWSFRDFRGENSIGWTPGDRLSFGGNITPEIDDTYGYARLGDNLLPLFQSRDDLTEFSAGADWDPALAGSWEMRAWNGENLATRDSVALGALEQLPLVTNIRLVPDDLTPIIRWDLPAGNNVAFDRIQIGLFDDVSDFRLWVFGNDNNNLFEGLPPEATEYRFEPDVLEFGKRYVVRVVLSDLNTEGETANRSLTFFNFTPIPGTSNDEIFLPTLDQSGVYNFDVDVVVNVPINIDPVVAIGYRYEIGVDNPRFASVSLPVVGDGLYDLEVYDDAGNIIDQGALAAATLFDFRSLDASGVSAFQVTGIEPEAGLDPLDTTAFVTRVSFAGSGRFTGTMTPITLDIPDETEVMMCDVDGDELVDIRDIRAIALLRTQPSSGEDDPADFDGDGIITLLDVRSCQASCTLPRCAIP